MTLLFIATTVNAQEVEQDSVVVYDTVKIYKEPFVINKTVILPKTKRPDKRSTFFIGLTGGVNYYNSFNDVCEQCKEFYASTKSSNKVTLGYLGGLDVMFKPGRFFLLYGIHYTTYRENFNFTDSNAIGHSKTNTLSYIENALGGGIRIGKDKNIQVLLGAQAKLNILNDVNGISQDSASQKYVVDIREVHTYRKLVPGALVSLNVLCRIGPSLYLMPGISYSYDLRSIVDNTGPFTIQRTIPAFKLSLVKGL